MLRIGMLGCGGIAAVHMKGFALIPDRVEITAVCDVDADRAEHATHAAGRARR